MPKGVLYQNLAGEVKSEGVLPAELQIQQCGFITKELISEGTFNRVETSHAIKGRYLFSDGFGPCVAVVADLKNGEYALYHAAYPHSNVPGFNDFVNEIVKKEKADITIFCKTSQKKNFAKSAFLFIVLKENLPNCNIKRIVVDQYTAIIADAKNRNIILLNKIDYISANELKKYHDSVSTQKILDPNQNSISLEETIKFAKEQQHTEGTLLDIKIPDSFPKPEVQEIKSTSTSSMMQKLLATPVSPTHTVIFHPRKMPKSVLSADELTQLESLCITSDKQQELLGAPGVKTPIPSDMTIAKVISEPEVKPQLVVPGIRNKA